MARLFIHWLLAAAFLVPFSARVAAATPVSLTAVDRPGGAALQGSVSWTIVRLNNTTGQPEASPAATGTAPTLETDLPPGHYMITAEAGAAAVKQPIFIGYSATQRNIPMSLPSQPVAAPVAQQIAGTPAVPAQQPANTQATNQASATQAAPAAQPATQPVPASAVAGPPAKLSINMIASSGNKPIKEAIGWQVFTYDKGGTESGVKVADMASATGIFSLPPGSYVVRAHYRETEADLVIPMAPGQSYTYTINLYAGYAKLFAIKTKEIARAGVVWQIVKRQPNAQGEYALVAESKDSLPNLMVREGKYLAIARQGEQWGVEPLDIKAGQTNKLKVTLRKGVGAPVIATAN